VYTFDTLDFEFDMLCRSLNPAETAWFLMIDSLQIDRVAERSLSIERTWNECYDQETYLGGDQVQEE
jgi:hypothetical protein